VADTAAIEGVELVAVGQVDTVSADNPIGDRSTVAVEVVSQSVGILIGLVVASATEWLSATSSMIGLSANALAPEKTNNVAKNKL